MAGITPVHSAKILSSRCAGVIRSAQGLCDLLVIFSASSPGISIRLGFFKAKLNSKFTVAKNLSFLVLHVTNDNFAG